MDHNVHESIVKLPIILLFNAFVCVCLCVCLRMCARFISRSRYYFSLSREIEREKILALSLIVYLIIILHVSRRASTITYLYLTIGLAV